MSTSNNGKKIQQFILMKKYYGNQDNKKSPKRQKSYIQKTIIKEKVNKMEKDSLPEYTSPKFELSTLTPNKIVNIESPSPNKTPCKVVTLDEDEENKVDKVVVNNTSKTKTFTNGLLLGALAVGGVFGLYQYSKNQ